MNLKLPRMFRWQYFNSMGNNCRLHRHSVWDAAVVIEAASDQPNDHADFWEGFYNCEDEVIVALPLQSDLF
jgi:hypothetical protein